MNRHFSEGDIQMADKHVKRYLASIVIREMQMESAAGCHVTSTRRAIDKRM